MRESVFDGEKVATEKWPRYKAHPRRMWPEVNRVELARAARPSFGPRDYACFQHRLAVLLGDLAEADPAPAPISRRGRVRQAR